MAALTVSPPPVLIKIPTTAFDVRLFTPTAPAMPHSEPFVFNTERRLVVLTGQKARNLPELLAILKRISGSSIFYHTHEE